MPTLYGECRNDEAMPTSKVRKVVIEKVLNGYVVEVGCKTLVFTDFVVMVQELGRYYANPELVEREYLERYK